MHQLHRAYHYHYQTDIFHLRPHHGPVNAHLHHLKKEHPANCVHCPDNDETVDNFLLHCPLYNNIKTRLLLQKDNGEKTEMVWARHEDGRRSRSEESDDESDTGEKEERETKDKVEGCVQEGHADCRTERGR